MLPAASRTAIVITWSPARSGGRIRNPPSDPTCCWSAPPFHSTRAVAPGSERPVTSAPCVHFLFGASTVSLGATVSVVNVQVVVR